MTPVDEAVERVREDLAHADAQGHHALLMPIEDLRALLSALELGRHLAKDALPGGETHPAALTSSLPADVVYALDWIEHARKAIAPLHSQGEDYIWRPVRRAMSALDAASEQLQPALSASTTDSGKGNEPVAWRVKDFADGWTLHYSLASAKREAEGAGNLIQPLFRIPPPAPPTGEGGGL